MCSHSDKVGSRMDALNLAGPVVMLSAVVGVTPGDEVDGSS